MSRTEQLAAGSRARVWAGVDGAAERHLGRGWFWKGIALPAAATSQRVDKSRSQRVEVEVLGSCQGILNEHVMVPFNSLSKSG